MTDDRSTNQPEPEPAPADVTQPAPARDDLTQPAPVAAAEPATAGAAVPEADPAPVAAPASTASPPAPSPASTGRSPLGVLRSIAAGLFFVLACLSLVLATTAWWVDDTFVDTEGFVAVAYPLAEDPAVQESLAQATATQVADALDLGPLGSYVALGISRELFSSDAFAQLWEGALRTVHTVLIAVLRDEREVVDLVDGQVYVNLYPFLDRILDRLATLDLVIAGQPVPVPSLTDPSDPEASRAELEAFVGRPLPPTFGTVPVARGENLVRAQQAFAVFQSSIVVLAALTLALAALAIAFARRRLRMVALVAVGFLASLLVVRLVVAAFRDAIADAVTGGGGVVVVGREVVGVLVTSYRELTQVVIVLALVATIVALGAAWAWNRRAREASAEMQEVAIADGWFLAIAGLCVALVALIAFGLTLGTLVVVAIGYAASLGVIWWTRRPGRATTAGA